MLSCACLEDVEGSCGSSIIGRPLFSVECGMYCTSFHGFYCRMAEHTMTESWRDLELFQSCQCNIFSNEASNTLTSRKSCTVLDGSQMHFTSSTAFKQSKWWLENMREV